MQYTCKFNSKETISSFDGLQKKMGGKWEDGKSAASLGKYVFEKEGMDKIRELISSFLPHIDRQINHWYIEECDFEHETKFDSYTPGRKHDLALFGKTDNGKSVFVGIEAKVNESFDSRTIQKAYCDGLINRANGGNSKLPARIESLIKRNNFKLQSGEKKCFLPDYLKLKYQLLFSTLGTAKEDCDICIFLVLVFKTKLYKENAGTQNYTDYLHFMNAHTYEYLSPTDDLRKVTVFTDDKCEISKDIYTAYHKVEMDEA